jgi:hypothetical protein
MGSHTVYVPLTCVYCLNGCSTTTTYVNVKNCMYVLVTFKLIHVLCLLLQFDKSCISSHMYIHALNYGQNVGHTFACSLLISN